MDKSCVNGGYNCSLDTTNYRLKIEDFPRVLSETLIVMGMMKMMPYNVG